MLPMHPLVHHPLETPYDSVMGEAQLIPPC